MIHPTAIIDPKAELDSNVEVGPYSIIQENVFVGSGTVIGPHVVIEDDVQIGNGNSLLTGAVLNNGVRLGNDNTVHEYAVIGGLPQDLGFNPTTFSYVTIGNSNTLREYVTVHRASWCVLTAGPRHLNRSIRITSSQNKNRPRRCRLDRSCYGKKAMIKCA